MPERRRRVIAALIAYGRIPENGRKAPEERRGAGGSCCGSRTTRTRRAVMPGAAEIRNRETLGRWEEHYNAGDVRAMIAECYAPDCVMRVMGAGSVSGHETFLAFEEGVLRTAPRRQLRVDHVHAAGDEVLVSEVVLLDPDRGADWELPFCNVMTLRDGKIVDDRNYLDFGRRPGSETLAAPANDGGDAR
jgi:ketosteroid isomerase-like protein